MTLPQNQHDRARTAGSAEETLRIVAGLPAPKGLEDRVHSRLRTGPRPVLNSSVSFNASNGFGGAMRFAAAAAIVCVVAGGGWGVYSRVQPGPDAHILQMPAAGGPGHGFSTAGSAHTPDPRPVHTRQIMPEPAPIPPAQGETVRAKKGADPAVRKAKTLPATTAAAPR